MSAIKNPQAKKRQSLRRDHRVYLLEGDKSFRGVWRKKKVRMAKKARADSRRALRRAESGDEDATALAKQPRQLRKQGIVSLGRDLQIRKHEPRTRFSTFEYSNREFTR